MTIDEDRTALQDFRRSLFGYNSGQEIMPEAFLSQLRHFATDAQATLGVRTGGTTRHAFWLKGGVLGHLSCTGNTDAEADISGWALRLDAVKKIDIDVRVVMDGPWSDSPGKSGRTLKIDGNVVLDASPGTALPDKLAEIERFIDAVLAAYAKA